MNLIITNTESQPILVWVWKKRFKKSIISEIWFRIEKIQVERIMMKKKLQEKKEVEKKLQEKKEVEKNNYFYWIFRLAISLWLPIIMRMKTFWIHKVTCILFLGVGESLPNDMDSFTWSLIGWLQAIHWFHWLKDISFPWSKSIFFSLFCGQSCD